MNLNHTYTLKFLKREMMNTWNVFTFIYLFILNLATSFPYLLRVTPPIQQKKKKHLFGSSFSHSQGHIAQTLFDFHLLFQTCTLCEQELNSYESKQNFKPLSPNNHFRNAVMPFFIPDKSHTASKISSLLTYLLNLHLNMQHNFIYFSWIFRKRVTNSSTLRVRLITM